MMAGDAVALLGEANPNLRLVNMLGEAGVRAIVAERLRAPRKANG